VNALITLAEKGLIPDSLIRRGIRHLCKTRRLDRMPRGAEMAIYRKQLLKELSQGPIAVHTQKANEQHYEVPPDFFVKALGPRLKYSSCYYPTPQTTLAEAEEHMLRLTCKRAGLRNGERILELGCGWGSLTLWMAENYPDSQITALSNSADQRKFIEARAKQKRLTNIRVITANINDFEFDEQVDRIVSVEMFEHMRNYQELFRRVAGWLKPEGTAFVHVFCHKTFPYLFELDSAETGQTDWMSRYFFTGGVMPSDDLYASFSDHLRIRNHWRVRGTHYERTSRHWLENIDREKAAVIRTFTKLYGSAEAHRWFHRWRLFFHACAELFGYDKGREWFVAHYLFEKANSK
jgi:cyclopropane-fatty-acyl-phospholipid synthase